MGIKPDTKLIAENLGVSEKGVEQMNMRLGSGSEELSIDRPVNASGGDQRTLGDILADQNAESLEDEVALRQGVELLKEHLEGFVSGLKERDRDIFQKRLLTDVPPSLQAIAEEYGVSRERIRQIEERLLKSLKVYMSEHIR